MPFVKIITPGTKFGLLTVIRQIPHIPHVDGQLECICECGVVKIILKRHLVGGAIISCGHVRQQGINSGKANTTHGLVYSRAYNIWSGMIGRCKDPNSESYPRYGGRGIRVCERWKSFENFHEDMGDPAEGMSLDRVDNDKGYSPDNCQWATKSQQARNRRSNTLVTHNGETHCIAEWAEKVNIKQATIWARIFTNNWSVEAALTTPTQNPWRKTRNPTP